MHQQTILALAEALRPSGPMGPSACPAGSTAQACEAQRESWALETVDMIARLTAALFSSSPESRNMLESQIYQQVPNSEDAGAVGGVVETAAEIVSKIFPTIK